MRSCFIQLLLFCAFSCFAQRDTINTDTQKNAYKVTDSIARTKTYNGDLKLLVSQLTEKCTTETEKARAVFIWITGNIAYDYKAFNKNKASKHPRHRLQKMGTLIGLITL